MISVTCSVRQVYPEPSLALSWYSEPSYPRDTARTTRDTSTTTVRRGMMYDVSVHSQLAPSLSQQTVFSCFMMIPGTEYSRVKKTMYNLDTDLARARRVSGSLSSLRGEEKDRKLSRRELTVHIFLGSFLTGVLLCVSALLQL